MYVLCWICVERMVRRGIGNADDLSEVVIEYGESVAQMCHLGHVFAGDGRQYGYVLKDKGRGSKVLEAVDGSVFGDDVKIGRFGRVVQLLGRHGYEPVVSKSGELYFELRGEDVCEKTWLWKGDTTSVDDGSGDVSVR